MRILVISCVFSPEPIVSARTSKDIAYELANQGHVVQVISTFPNRPAGKIYEGYQRKLWSREQTADEYDVLRLFTFFSSQSKVLSRFLENISFGIASGLAVLFLEKPGVVYGNTWPILAQGLLTLACKLRRIPLVLSVQDLYPESLFIQKRGFEKSSRFYRLLRWLDIQIARNCAGLVVISEQFKQTYICDRGIPENKITVIPNWIDDSQTRIAPADDDIRKKHDIPQNAFLVVYGGNIGVAAGVEYLIDAFDYLRKQEDIYFLIAGAGSSLSNCSEQIQKHGLERVKIHSPWRTEETFSVLSAADLCILPTQGEQSLVSVPSKLPTYMMAERCVLAIASPESETARIVTASEGGWVISESDPDAVGKRISEISRLSALERTQHGQAGRSYVTEHFSKNKHLSKVVEFLLQHGKQREQHSPDAIS